MEKKALNTVHGTSHRINLDMGWVEDNYGSYEEFCGRQRNSPSEEEVGSEGTSGEDSGDENDADFEIGIERMMNGGNKRQRTMRASHATAGTYGRAPRAVVPRSRSAESDARDREGKQAVDSAIAAAITAVDGPRGGCDFSSDVTKQLMRCTVVELQAYLRKAGLRAVGLKSELVERVKVR